MENQKLEHSSHIVSKDQTIINPNTDSAVIAKKSFTISDDQHRYQ
jgi:Fe-S cluster assembly iron-binding protein IscA